MDAKILKRFDKETRDYIIKLERRLKENRREINALNLMDDILTGKGIS